MFRRIFLAASGAIALTGAALAAEPLPPPPIYVPPPPMWTGFYAGLNAGYAFGGSNDPNLRTVSVFFDNPFMAAVANFPAALSGTGVLSAHNSGFIGGGQLGFNYQFATSWVAGIEADIQGTGARASVHALGIAPDPLSALLGLGFPTNAVSNLFAANAIDYLGTVRGRLGFLVTPSLLIYGDGGFAYGGVHQDIDISTTVSGTPIGGTPASGGFSRTRPGWTAGGGLEWMFMPNWSAKLEYLYYDLGTTAFDAGTQTIFIGIPPHLSSADESFARTRWNGSIVRFGLNYHFDGLPAPVDAASGAIAHSGASLRPKLCPRPRLRCGPGSMPA